MSCTWTNPTKCTATATHTPPSCAARWMRLPPKIFCFLPLRSLSDKYSAAASGGHRAGRLGDVPRSSGWVRERPAQPGYVRQHDLQRLG